MDESLCVFYAIPPSFFRLFLAITVFGVQTNPSHDLKRLCVLKSVAKTAEMIFSKRNLHHLFAYIHWYGAHTTPYGNS